MLPLHGRDGSSILHRGTKHESNMKTLISESGGFRLYVEINKIDAMSDLVNFKILSSYEDARDPEAERVALSMMLTDAELQLLKASI
jgi:hypothetical protein